MSAIFADVGFGTQAFFRGIADGISWTIVIDGASHERHAFGFSVGFRSRSFRAATFMRTRDIDANGTRSADVRTLTFINIEASGGRVARKTWRALATEATGCVATNRTLSAATLEALGEVAFVNILTSGGNVCRIVGPSFVAYAKRFFALGLASCVSAAFHIFARSFARGCWGFADETGFAFATMTAGQIGANRVGSARRFGAFVDIDASGSFRLETVAAETLTVQAFGVVDAIEIAFTNGGDIHLFACDVRRRLTGVSLRAATIVTGDGVLADGLLTARTA
jgi:hypothetical protein